MFNLILVSYYCCCIFFFLIEGPALSLPATRLRVDAADEDDSIFFFFLEFFRQLAVVRFFKIDKQAEKWSHCEL